MVVEELSIVPMNIGINAKLWLRFATFYRAIKRLQSTLDGCLLFGKLLKYTRPHSVLFLFLL